MIDIEKELTELIRKKGLAINTLTEAQFVDALRQAIESGDFVRFVSVDERQKVVYLPFQQLTYLRGRLHALSDRWFKEADAHADQKHFAISEVLNNCANGLNLLSR